jgi:chromosome segregation ATPase
LVDELEQAENLSESPSGGENSPEAEELGARGEVTELESRIAQKAEELAKANARLVELEQVVAGKDSEIAGLKQDRDELEGRLTTLSNSLAQAVASYKAMVVQANPEVIDELIGGDTIESINDSLDKAKDLVKRVRQGIETEISLAKVPAGAPERTSPDLSALSPREKIQYAIGGKR